MAQPKPYNEDRYSSLDYILRFQRNEIGEKYKINYGTYCCGFVKAPFYKRVLNPIFKSYSSKYYDKIGTNLSKIMNCKAFFSNVDELVDQYEEVSEEDNEIEKII